MQSKFRFLLIICISASMAFLSSCGKDDDEPAGSAIVGTWTYSDSEISILVDNKSISQFLIANGTNPTEAALQESFYKVFLKNFLDLEGTSFVFYADGKYEVLDNGVVQESGTYQINSNNTKLTFTSTEGLQEVDIEELTNNRLSLSFSEEEMEDFNDDGALNTISLDILFKLVK